MTWTDYPVADGDNLAKLSFYTQLVEAFNERRAAWRAITGGGVPGDLAEPIEDALFTIADRAAGWVETAFSWKIFQEEILLERFRFVPGKPVDNDATTFNNTWLADVANFYTDAGLNALGFTRKYPREISATTDSGSNGQRARHEGNTKFYDHDGVEWLESDDQTTLADLITAHGTAQQGDIVGIWLFNEAQDCINTLRYLHVDDDDTGMSRNNLAQTSAFQEASTFAAAVSAAEADYDADTPVLLAGNTAWISQITRDDSDPGGPYISCRIVSKTLEVAYTIPTGYTVDILTYAAINDNFGNFSATGSPTKYFDYSILSASAITSGNIAVGTAYNGVSGTQTIRLFADTRPDSPSTTLADGDEELRGFQAPKLDAILDFNVAGGFDYRA